MKRIYFIHIIFFGFFFSNVHAQKESAPEGGRPKDFKLPVRQTQEFDNGLKANLIPYGNTPKVYISLIIKAGAAHESPAQVGLATLTGRMLREGTASMDFAGLSKKAALMGGSLDVSVGLAETHISGSVLSEYAADFIRMVSGLLSEPAFPEKELDRIKTNLLREYATDKEVPQNIAVEKFYATLYKDHRYGKLFPSEEIVKGFSSSMVRDFWKQNYGAKRSVLYVVGIFDDKKVRTAISESLAKWNAGPEIRYPAVSTSNQGGIVYVNRDKAPQTTVIMGLPVITPDNKDYLPLLITNSLLGGSFGSRITSNIRENKGYTYSPYSTISNRKGTTLWYEMADVTSEHTADAINEIKKEIAKLATDPPSKEELDGIKTYESGIFVLRNSMPQGIVSQLNFIDQYKLDEKYLTNMVSNINKIQPATIRDMVKRYIRDDKMTIVLVGDEKDVKTQIGKGNQLKGF